MPFYEYQCGNCGHHVEVLQKVSDSPLRKCPSCGRARLKRLMSRVAFRLKGGGWYETDFKSDAENKRNLVGEEQKPAAEPAPADATAKPDATETPAKAAPAEKPAVPAKTSRRKTAAKPKARARPAPRPAPKRPRPRAR